MDKFERIVSGVVTAAFIAAVAASSPLPYMLSYTWGGLFGSVALFCAFAALHARQAHKLPWPTYVLMWASILLTWAYLYWWMKQPFPCCW